MGRRAPIIAMAIAVVVVVAAAPQALSASPAETDVAEQWLIYDLNRARWNPTAYAAEHGVTPSLAQGPVVPQPPLAPNDSLLNATAFKAQQTVVYPNYFNSTTHCTTATGELVCPDQLANSYGYPIAPNPVNSIESGWYSTGAGFTNGSDGAVADFLKSEHHVGSLFVWTDRQEVGVGWADGCPSQVSQWCNWLFVDSAGRNPAVRLITGVVFNDLTHNSRMDLGEGLGGVTVSLNGGASTTTKIGGIYTLGPVGPGTYTVTASGSGVSSSAQVRVIDHNVGVDFKKGTAAGVVHEYPSRLAGADRYGTAVEVSRFSHPNGADVVYLAIGTNYPDAIAAAPAAAAEDAPILLVTATGIPASTLAELNRLHPTTIVILGGTAAISDGVVAELGVKLPFATVVRRFGPTRYETATAISQGAFPGTVHTVYVATGENFPDALVAGPAAVQDGAPILLVRPNDLPAAVAAELERLDPAEIVVVGSSQAVSNLVVSKLGAYAPTTRISGADRYAVSAEVARTRFPNSATVYVATGNAFPDALAAGPAIATAPGPIILVSWTIPSSIDTELKRVKPRHTIVVLGGTAAVADTILSQLVRYLPD